MTLAARPSSATDRTRHSRRSLFSILFFGVLLSGCMWPAAAQPTDDLFEQYEVVTGSAQRQTVLVGFLLGGAMAELAVVNVDENWGRHLRIYAFEDGNWVPSPDYARDLNPSEILAPGKSRSPLI